MPRKIAPRVEGPYHVIYADPPYAYRVIKPGATFKNPRVGRGIVLPYATMSVEDICALPVREMAARDCALFLWVTSPCLEQGLKVMSAWGFAYKTIAFNWVKLNRKRCSPWNGGGHYTRANSEICLIGTRGRPKRKATGVNVQQLIAAPVREPSRKPDEVYERIMALYDGPYLELFARQQWPGWSTAISNEVGKYAAQVPLLERGAARMVVAR